MKATVEAHQALQIALIFFLLSIRHLNVILNLHSINAKNTLYLGPGISNKASNIPIR
jgi:hypothetical protein